MNLTDILSAIEKRKLANEEFCNGEREFGEFLAEVSSDTKLTEEFCKIVPIMEIAVYCTLHGSVAFDELTCMKLHLEKWIEKMKQETSSSDEEFPEIIEMEP